MVKGFGWFVLLALPAAAACTGLIGADWDGNGRLAGSPDGAGLDAGPVLGVDASTIVYCGIEPDAGACLCGVTKDYGTSSAPCQASLLSAPVLCCASDQWPATSTCSCWTLGCSQDESDTCDCQQGILAPATSSCTGQVCCVYDGYEGVQTCSCWTDPGVTSCALAAPLSENPPMTVSSCSLDAGPGRVGCEPGYHPVASCR